MIPRDTVYRLARSPRDYAACHALMELQKHQERLRWPTIMAERNGQLIALLGTEPHSQAVLCGPLVVSPHLSNPTFVCLRLWELYETLMRQAGVARFLFYVHKANTRWLRWLEHLELEPWQQVGDVLWFWRETERWAA